MTAARLLFSASLLTVVVGASSCDPIAPHPLINAPKNVCPCDGYDPATTSTAPRCTSRNQCEVLTAGGRPEYAFWIVVHVPDSSIYAPGLTFVLYSDAQGNPAFKKPDTQPGVVPRCQPPLCLPLGALVSVGGAYQVTAKASDYVGYPLIDGASLPVRVVYAQTGNEQQTTFPTLPLDVLFAVSSTVDKNGHAQFSRPVPAGNYHRIFYPQPPYDEYFPPRNDPKALANDFETDAIFLGGVADNQIDDQGGTARVAKIKRAAGLDGWRAWLVDRVSQQRISVIRRLSGTQAQVELYTSGAEAAFRDDNVEAVVAPPDDWVAVPSYVTRLFGGSGLQSLDVPPIPTPVTVAGVVVEPTANPQDPLFGYAAQVSFESQELTTDTGSSSLLRYSTTVSTDDRGRFATVLPPGTYAAAIAPAEGTGGYALRKELVVVDRALTALKFQPPPQTLVKGRAVLTDGRPLREAEVIAVPNTAAVPAGPLSAVPRPGRTHTDIDGHFELKLDPGPYVLSIVPAAGTGFPRVVIRPEIPGSASGQSTELPDVRVPAPTRLAFTLRDPSPTGNAIANAVVRIFAQPASGSTGGSSTLSDPVEVGSAMTDADGSVEILLAQEPR